MDKIGFVAVRGVASKSRLSGGVKRNGLRPSRWALLVLAVGIAATGCVQVPPQRQRLVSKPSMEFSDSLAFGYQHKLLPQVEPGTAFSGGAQSSGCAACK